MSRSNRSNRSNRSIRTISDRRKVMLVVIGLTIASTAIVAFLTVRATRNRLVTRTDVTLENQLATAKVAMNVLSPDTLQTLSQLDSIVPSDIGFVSFAPDGRMLTSHGAEPNGTPRPLPRLPGVAELQRRIGHPFDASAPDGSAYRVLTGSVSGGSTVVAFTTPLTAVNQTVHDLRNTVIVVGGVAIAILSLLLWFLLSALTRPVETMVDAATRIGDGDLTVRIPAKAVRGDARRLGDALNQMVTRLEAASDARAASEARLRQFIADASHELRSPLTNVRGYSQLLLMGADTDEPLALQRIAVETARMSALVDDMLRLARLDQGRHGPKRTIDVGALVAGLVRDARVVEPDRPIALDLPATRCAVLAEADALPQAVGNLLANVRVHTDPRTPCTVAVETAGESVMITVSDLGPGMARDDAAHAFDRFFRTDVARGRATGGTGLGLGICKAIVEDLGGSLSLTTAPGEGLRVQIVLPTTAADNAAAEAEPSVARA